MDGEELSMNFTIDKHRDRWIKDLIETYRGSGDRLKFGKSILGKFLEINKI